MYTAIIRGIKNGNDSQIKVLDDVYATAALQRNRPGTAEFKIKKYIYLKTFLIQFIKGRNNVKIIAISAIATPPNHIIHTSRWK